VRDRAQAQYGEECGLCAGGGEGRDCGEDADCVLVVERGEIVERGSHDELCAMEGVYKKLVLRQLMSKESADAEC